MKTAVVASLFVLAGCASTELEIPDNHPANAKAAAAPVPTSKVLQPDFDPFADGAEQPAPPAHQHHHGHQGSEK